MVYQYWVESNATSNATCSTTCSTGYTSNRWQTCTITSTTSGANDLTVWGRWHDGTLTVTQDNSTWSNWTITSDTCYVGEVNGERPRQSTEQERQRYEQERIRMEQLAVERERKAREAEERSLQLLEENLTENQKEVYKSTGVIPVQCSSGRKYHIRKGVSSNVHELDEKGGTKRRLCFHPTGVPVYDVMLAQKLMLEVCEEEALKVANFS